MRDPRDRFMPLTRRRVVGSALAGSAALALPWPVLAQEATPAASGEAIKSLTREEYEAQLIEELGFTEAQTPGGTFIASYTADIQTVHPFLAEEDVSITVAALLFEQLVGGDVRNGQPAPTGLADSWEVASDGRTYTFYLDPDAVWHDGTPVTADDVIFSFDALANPDTGSVYTGSFVDAVASYRAIDEHTVKVVAVEPLFTFLYDLVAYIVPKHIWESVPFAEWRNDPGATGTDPLRVVGSGPFKFQEWQQGQSVTLVRNDEYHGKVPHLKSYVLTVWPEQTAVVNALLNGEIDAAALEPSDIAPVQGTPGIVVEHYPTRGFSYYEFNLNDEATTLWQDRQVRQAMMYAIDRESIVNDIWLGYAEAAQGTQPVISYAYAPDQLRTKYIHDPEKARALLAEAGWTDTDGDGIVDKGAQRLSFELLYISGSPITDQLVAYLQDAWKAIGIDANPRSLEFPAWIEAVTTNLDWEVALGGFLWDATFIQDIMFGCAQYRVGFNDMKYCNPELDEINAKAKRTFDEERRRELLIEASNIVNDEQPVGVLLFSQDHAAYNENLRNYIPSTWGVDLSYVWIQQ